MTVLGRRYGSGGGGSVLVPGQILIGQDYFVISDQTGFKWYWWISYDYAAVWRQRAEHEFDREVKSYLTNPYWIKLGDTDSVTWWLYPDLDGSPLLQVNQPPIGQGITGSPKLRPRDSFIKYQYAVRGGDLDVVPAS